MTEAEWNRSADPLDMAEQLPPGVPRRKLVLFVIGCCRQFEKDITRPSAQQLLETAERFADARATGAQLNSALATATAEHSVGNNALKGRNHRDRGGLVAVALVLAAVGRAPTTHGNGWSGRPEAVRSALREVQNHSAHRQNPNTSFFSYDDARDQVRERLADLFRDIVGPLPAGAPFEPAWLTSDVLALAQGIYDERAFDRMPILADALQDAGCTDERVLGHCRNAKQVHARGCWVIDSLLGFSANTSGNSEET